MKFISTLRLALHSLMQNKVRTALTVVIITVVSFVVVYLFSFLFSLQTSLNENFNVMIHGQGVELSASANYRINENTSHGNVGMPLNKVDEILEVLDDGSGNFTYITMRANVSLVYTDGGTDMAVRLIPYHAGSNPFIGQQDYLTAGRLWNGSDGDAGNIFLSKAFADDAGIDVGDTVSMRHNSESELSYTVRGVIDADAGNYYNYSAYLDYRSFDQTPVYSDNYNYESNQMCISTVTAVLTPQEGEKYGTEYQNYITGVIERIEEIRFDNSRLSISAYSTIQTIMMIISILFWIFFGFIIFLCVVIILLSINSVSNTVRISAEQNRKFFGMMKAIGMKNNTMRAILIMQVVIMLLIGVGLATGIAFFAVGGLEYFIGLIVEQIFFSIGNAFVTMAAVYPAVPFITFGLLTLFVILFTWTSLAEVSRMDVITVINEVS